MTILELMEKRAKAWETAKDFLNTHVTDSGLSSEDEATHSKLLADVENLTKAIQKLEEQQTFDDALKNPTSTAITNNPSADKKAEELKKFTAAIRCGNLQNALMTAPDEQGGYLVPETFWNEIVMKMTEINAMRRLCRVITTANDINVPLEDGQSTVGYVGEGALISETNVTFKQKKLSAYKLAALMKVSAELLQDSMFDITAYIRDEFAKRLANKEESEFLSGDGLEGHISGLLTAADLKTVDAAGATAITFDDVIELIHGVLPQYRNGANFLTSDAAMKMLRKIKDNTGNYIWSPSIVPGQPDRIYSYPINISSVFPVPVTGGKSMVFGDFKGYWIGSRLNPTIMKTADRYFEYDVIGFRVIERIDGKLINAEALAALKMK